MANPKPHPSEEEAAPETAIPEHQSPSLPPRDHGIAAWTSLTAISAIAMATWGFSATQGVFREYYLKHPPYEGNQLVASIGLLGVGLLQGLSPFLLHFIGRRPEVRPYMMWTGMVAVVASTIGAAFSTTVTQVIATQGLLYGISSGILFAPCISYVDEWFLKRRGLANGIFFGAANIASAILSPVFAVLLRRFGPRTTLIGWAIFIAVVISLGIVCVRSRPEITRTEEEKQLSKSSLRPLKSPLLWLFVLSMALQSLANNLPANYLPSYATDLGVGSDQAALLVTYLCLAGIVGQVLLGALTDAIGPLVPFLLSVLVSSFAVFVVWGVGKAYWTMVIVSILFGAFAFSFMTLRSHMAAIVVNDEGRSGDQLFVSGLLLFTRGAIGVVSAFVAAAVLESKEHVGVNHGYGAGKWQSFIILLGTTMTAALVGVFGLLGRKGR